MKKIGTLILAIGLVIGLTACKTDMSNLELTGITVTLPAKVTYSVGEDLNTEGMVVTATYSDGSTKDVTAEVTATGYDKTKAGEQTVTVSYTENEITKTASFTVTVKEKEAEPENTPGKTPGKEPEILFNWYETPEPLNAGTDGSYGTEGTYVYFGVWPQDVVPKADETTLGLETSTEKVTRGYMEFVKGSDGNYYVKCEENAYNSDCKYNKDDSDVGQGGTNFRWFKVMPIKWRVVDESYKDASGTSKGKLIVAENILTANIPYYESISNHRNGTYAHNYMHSQIRAYLNGISYNASSESDEGKWLNKGFLQTAFTSTAINSIITTKVDNAKEQMSHDGITESEMNETYACAPTDDKIFLLSYKEILQYSKEPYYSGGVGNSRIRVTTNFAIANNAYWSDDEEFVCSAWWLRSPAYYAPWLCDYCARYVYGYGNSDDGAGVDDSSLGVVPALSIKLQ